MLLNKINIVCDPVFPLLFLPFLSSYLSREFPYLFRAFFRYCCSHLVSGLMHTSLLFFSLALEVKSVSFHYILFEYVNTISWCWNLEIFRHSNCSISKQSLLSIKLQEPIVSRFWMPYNRNPIVSISHTMAEQLCIQAQPSSWFSVTPLYKWYYTALSHHSKYSFPASAFPLSLQVLTDCQIVITLFLVALSKKIRLCVLSAQVNHLFSFVYN